MAGTVLAVMGWALLWAVVAALASWLIGQILMLPLLPFRLLDWLDARRARRAHKAKWARIDRNHIEDYFD